MEIAFATVVNLTNLKVQGVFVTLEYPYSTQLNLAEKSGATLLYLIQVLASLILISFYAYERQGYANPFRSMNNQLGKNY